MRAQHVIAAVNCAIVTAAMMVSLCDQVTSKAPERIRAVADEDGLLLRLFAAVLFHRYDVILSRCETNFKASCSGKHTCASSAKVCAR